MSPAAQVRMGENMMPSVVLPVVLFGPLWCPIWCYTLRRDLHGFALLCIERAEKASAYPAAAVAASAKRGERYGASLHRFAAVRIGLHRRGRQK